MNPLLDKNKRTAKKLWEFSSHSRRSIGYFLAVAGSLFVLSVVVSIINHQSSIITAKAQTFLGPGSNSAGTGQGAVGVDSSYNIAVGTSTTQADTKLLIVGTSTTGTAGSGYFAIKVLDAQRGPLFIVRGDGSVSIGSPYIQTSQSSATSTVSGVGNAPANGALFVNGPIFTSLDIKADGGISVGTTTPQTGGSIYAAGGITAGGTLSAANYSGSVSAGNTSAGQFGLNTGGGNYSFPASVAVGTSTSATLFSVATSTNIFNVTNTGRVGIGTVGPTGRLDVRDAGTIPSIGTAGTGLNMLRADGLIGLSIGFNTSNNSVYIQNQNLTNSQALDLTLQPLGGNVGIGTATPGSKLVIMGAPTGFLKQVIQNTAAGTGNGVQFNLGVDNDDGNFFIQSYSSTYTTSADGSARANGANVYAEGTGGLSLSSGQYAMRFYTGLAGVGVLTEKMRIEQGGNVGIGTTNPTSTLTVAGAVKSTTGGFIFPDGTTQTTAGGGASQWTTTGSDIYYNTGNVGIGTTGPTNKLTVLADGTINTTGDPIDVGASIIGSNRNFSTSGNYALLNIQSNSTLGADVGGTLGFGGRYTGTNFAQYGIIKGAKENATDLDYAGYLAFGTRINGGLVTEKVRISGSGNVGIGTTGPGSVLHVRNLTSATTGIQEIANFQAESSGATDSGYAGRVKITVENPNGNSPSVGIAALNSASGSNIADLALYGGSGAATMAEYVRILGNTGNVGIGVSPSYKLDVSGTGNFTQPVIVGTPTNASHAATRSYVDGIITSSNVATFATTTIARLGGNLDANGYNITAVNKLTVTTIDPVYNIGGVKYATYGADTVGLKTEIYGKAALDRSGTTLIATQKDAESFSVNPRGYPRESASTEPLYTHVIDFNKAGRGSDLWLFWQTIDEGKDMKDIVVSLTPEFDGRVWYELNPARKQIVIYGELRSGTTLIATQKDAESFSVNPRGYPRESASTPMVSYHLAAPRHDASRWSNIAVDATETGTILNVK